MTAAGIEGVETMRGHRRAPRVHVALGSGGARGLAHIGVIEGLLAHGCTIEAVAGSSMGALVGGIHAAGRLDAYRDWVCGLTRKQIAQLQLLDLGVGAGGLFKGERVMKKLRELVGDTAIEQLPLPFTAVATDLETGDEVRLRRGSLFEAIRASMAAPMVFTPHRLDDRLLSDGGLVNPLPVSALPPSRGALVVAVDLSGPPLRPLRQSGERGVIDVALLSMQAVQDTVNRLRLQTRPPDLHIEIPRDACGFHEFWRADELIALGRSRLEEALRATRPLSIDPTQGAVQTAHPATTQPTRAHTQAPWAGVAGMGA